MDLQQDANAVSRHLLDLTCFSRLLSVLITSDEQMSDPGILQNSKSTTRLESKKWLVITTSSSLRNGIKSVSAKLEVENKSSFSYYLSKAPLPAYRHFSIIEAPHLQPVDAYTADSQATHCPRIAASKKGSIWLAIIPATPFSRSHHPAREQRSATTTRTRADYSQNRFANPAHQAVFFPRPVAPGSWVSMKLYIGSGLRLKQYTTFTHLSPHP